MAELITHALEDDPNECCGLLLGTGEYADELYRMSNVNKKPISRYTMQPGELLEAQEKAKNSDREFVAIYHSHTFTQGYPSLTDVKNSVKVSSISTRHVIVSLVEKNSTRRSSICNQRRFRSDRTGNPDRWRPIPGFRLVVADQV